MYRRYNDTFKQYISMNLSKDNISMRVLASTYKMFINKCFYRRKKTIDEVVVKRANILIEI